MVDGRVLIVGAGIGGLSLAVALRRAGREVLLLEECAASQRRSAEAGMTLAANGLSALREIGLDLAVAGSGQTLSKSVIRTARGRLLASVSLGQSPDEFGSPTIALHRSDLAGSLRNALDALGPGVVACNFSVARYEQGRDGVVAISSDERTVEGAILVGADGLFSQVRSQLVGDGPPLYAGYTNYRGVAPAADLVPPGESSESWGRGRSFGTVPIGRGDLYWSATVNAEAGSRYPVDPIRTLRVRFREWHRPIDEILCRTPVEVVARSDIFYRPPIRRWSDGRVVLLGDAAHPMTPSLWQGGCQAIEDAVVLSRALMTCDSPTAAFREYEAARVQRANGVARRSRSFGEVTQSSRFLPRLVRDTAFWLAPRAVVVHELRPLLTFAPPPANAASNEPPPRTAA